MRKNIYHFVKLLSRMFFLGRCQQIHAGNTFEMTPIVQNIKIDNFLRF